MLTIMDTLCTRFNYHNDTNNMLTQKVDENDIINLTLQYFRHYMAPCHERQVPTDYLYHQES